MAIYLNISQLIVIISLLGCNANIIQKGSNQPVTHNEERPSQRNLFDEDLYEESLDPDLCHKQLVLLSEYTEFSTPFLDAGIRIPRGLTEGNLVDMGNYHQCLSIRQDIEDTTVEGKYCSIQIPLNQDIELQIPTWPVLPTLPEIVSRQMNEYETLKKQVGMLMLVNNTSTNLRTASEGVVQLPSLTLAICIPKVCTTQEAVDFVFENITDNSLEFSENFCRLPNDKPIMPVDYVALVIFSIIGFVVLISTCYDLGYIFLFKKDPTTKNELYSSFSVYTNTRRLLTFKSSSDALECLDGIRAISIIWVIVGHTHTASIFAHMQNPLTVFEWIQSLNSLWITAAPLSVDTFFMMSGLLSVYTLAKKTNRWSFIKNVHMFYLHRYLRMFPLLAAAVLLQASLAHRVADGPEWGTVAANTENCRRYWWAALLHVQNYVNYDGICIGQTWYLSVDMQLYWISPIVLIWVCAPSRGDGRRTAWSALTLALLASLLASTIYCFLMDFPSSMFGRITAANNDYMRSYYINTLTRAPPFFIGMIFGYVLHIWRDSTVKLSAGIVSVFWAVAVALSSFAFFITYPTSQSNYDNQLFDNFLNSYMRSFWAIAVGWMVFACVHGYGGPINWFLSLQMWKLPARLSYAMYLVHFTLMFIVNGTWLSPLYFTEFDTIYRFFGDLIMAIIAAYILTLLVDSPFSTLQKIFLGGGQRKKPSEPTVKNIEDLNGEAPVPDDLESRTKC